MLIGAALLPSWARNLFLSSPPMALWRRWAARTTAEGLREALPGDDEESRRLRSYAIGLWLDVGSPPVRSSLLSPRLYLRDRGFHSNSARFAYDGGHFSA